MNSDNDKNLQSAHLSATAEIVAAYLTNHKTDLEGLDTLIDRVYSKLGALSAEMFGVEFEQTAGATGIRVEDSVQPDYIVCLEDGKKLKMLKRYLKTNYDMSPDEYRKRWNLPADYPMVAPNYAKKRSRLAKEIGLGKKTAEAATQARAIKAEAKKSSSASLSPNGKDTLPKGKGRLRIVKSTDVMKGQARST
jgi:predicted transcriptional regulator